MDLKLVDIIYVFIAHSIHSFRSFTYANWIRMKASSAGSGTSYRPEYVYDGYSD